MLINPKTETFSKQIFYMKDSQFPSNSVSDIMLILWESSSGQGAKSFLESIHNPAFAFDKLLHCYKNPPLCDDWFFLFYAKKIWFYKFIFQHFLYHYIRNFAKMFQKTSRKLFRCFPQLKNHFTWAKSLYILYKTNFYSMILIDLKQNV